MQRINRKGNKSYTGNIKESTNQLINKMVENAGMLSTQRVLNLKSKKNIPYPKMFNGKKKKCQLLSEKFDELFNGRNLKNPISSDYFLERISQVKGLDKIAFLIAGYLFFRVIMIPDLFRDFEENSYNIKVFATCIYLAQKYYLDIHYHSKDMGKLLGLKRKSLNKKEIFLFEHAFGFDLKINKRHLTDFKTWLRNLNNLLEQLEPTKIISHQKSNI